VRRAADAGVRLSLGSDGHRIDQVGNIVTPLALTRAVGVADDRLYDPERHGSRTGAFDA
jgi:histidinol phosphatase-like PHP family hydrolase